MDRMQSAIVRKSPAPVGDEDRIAPEGVSPLLWRLYQARGVASARDVERDLAGLIPPSRMAGLDAAVDLLVAALQRQQRILVIGDFDADGATSCALAVRALRAFGCSDVDFLVPNRFEFGYGLTPEIVEFARSREPANDRDGRQRHFQRGRCRRREKAGLAGDGDRPPSGGRYAARCRCHGKSRTSAATPLRRRHWPGVGVIFYVLLGLRGRLREIAWFESHAIADPNMAEYLDLVALGTVADVVPLDRNNRILVHQGLARIRAGRCRPGITACCASPGAIQRARRRWIWDSRWGRA